MRLKQFLKEQAGPKSFRSIEDIGNLIKSECSEFLRQSNGVPLYRGSKEDIPGLTYQVPRKDRRPRDTSLQLHELFDEVFDEVLGHKVRSAGVFATAYDAQARVYGKLYYIFPKDGYSVIWSREIFDLYSVLTHYTGIPDLDVDKDTETFFSIIKKHLGKFPEFAGLEKLYKGEGGGSAYRKSVFDFIEKHPSEYREAYKAALTWLVRSKYEIGNMRAALAARNEMVIMCDGYYMIEYDYLNGEIYDSYKEFLDTLE